MTKPEYGQGLQIFGNPGLLDYPRTALFAASGAPSDLILPTLHIAAEWPRGRLMISGFQAPIERAVLDVILTARLPALAVLPAPIRVDRLRRGWRSAFENGTLLVGWPAGAAATRATERMSVERNRRILAFATSTIVASGRTASRTYRIAREAAAVGLPLLCHDHPGERDLVLLGAVPVRAGSWRAALAAS